MSNNDKLWPLKGGIHPAQMKDVSNGTPIKQLSQPKEIILPLNHSNGAMATPCVNVGDQVKKGQLIATFNIPVATRIHASLSGTITAIEPRAIAHVSGLQAQSIVITTDQSGQIEILPKIDDWKSVSHDLLIRRIEEAGIAGLGGAGFPTQIKYRPHTQINTLIVNGVECEPYITSDDVLMREHSEQIVEGTLIALKILSAKDAIIAIEDNKPEAIGAIKAALNKLDTYNIRLRVIPTKYPSGGEKQLIYILTGQEVSSGNIPASLGILVQNVGTLYALRQAVVDGEPLTQRVMTLTGSAVNNPGNYWVPIGTPIQHIMNESTRDLIPHKIVMGGPMMGFDVPDANAPISKITNCIIIPTKQELPTFSDSNPCIRCGKCEQVCPVNLLPQKLYWNAKYHEWEQAELNSLFDCIECGACSWICPSEISLVQYYRYAKSEIKKEHLDKVKSDQARHRFEDRQRRLEKLAAEKESKRKARAAAAAKIQSNKDNTTESVLDDQAKADILASLARVKAKKPKLTTKVLDTKVVDTKALELAWQKTEDVVLKAKAKLLIAQQENSASVPALTTALGKLEERAKKAKLTWQDAVKFDATTIDDIEQ